MKYIVRLITVLLYVAGAWAMADAKPKKLSDNISWELRSDTLWVYGRGEIPAFKSEQAKAWKSKDIWPFVKVIEIGEGITAVGEYAFANPSEYSEKPINANEVRLYLPYSLQYIRSRSFSDLSIRDLYLPKNLIEIELGAFKRNTPSEPEMWEEVVFPKTLKDIEMDAFAGRNIRKFVFTGPTEYSTNGLYLCNGLEEIDFGNQAVRGYLLRHFSADIPESLKRVRNFGNVVGMSSKMKALTVDKRPPVETEIGGWTYRMDFRDHKAVLLKGDFGEDVVIPDAVNYEGEAYPVGGCMASTFKGNTLLRSVALPANMTAIPAEAFRGCTSLESVTFPSGLRNIGDFAFRDCVSLKSVILPSGTRKIGDAAFENCQSLSYVSVPDGLRRIGEHCFSLCPSLTSITVPDACEKGHDWFGE